jgi:hypothetical protein
VKVGRKSISVRGLLYARLADHCETIGMPLSTFVEALVAERHPAPSTSRDDSGIAHAVDTISSALRGHFREVVQRGSDTSTVRQHQLKLARRRLQMLARVQGAPETKLRELTKLLVEMASE